VKATAKCPCGRRQIHLAVRQVRLISLFTLLSQILL
jgi:hypothetical protein